jgi:F0F1-type ATP synthase membrane subunit a
MLIYSINPTKPYAKELLYFAWKKPLYSVITSTLCLSLMVLIAQTLFKMNIPLTGTAIVTLPPEFTEGVSISVLATSAFQWPLGLALTAATLCIIARIYHKKTTQQ